MNLISSPGILITLLVEFFLFLVSVNYYFKPPVKPNPYYGFRTKLSLSSQENWSRLNKKAAAYLLITMGLNLFISVLFFLTFYKTIDGNRIALINAIKLVIFLTILVYVLYKIK